MKGSPIPWKNHQIYPPWRPTAPNLKPKNVRIPSHKARQEPSRRSFGSSFNFRISFFDFSSPFSKQIQEFTIVSNPKGDKKTPSIRIRVRHVFHVFSTYYEKRFFIKTICFKGVRAYLRYGEAEMWKSNARYRNPLWTHFFVFSWHPMKHIFYQNDIFQ